MTMDKVVHIFSQDEEKLKDLKNKKDILERNKIERQWTQYTEQLERAENIRIDPSKFPKVGQSAKNNEQYQEDVEKALPFINAALSRLIQVLPRNLYVIGGITGGGKSTTVSNIIMPILKAGRRILVIANEEHRDDVYNRIACRILKYSFTKFKTGEYHKSIRDKINEEVTRLEPFITVCGTDFMDNPDMVCTPEGVRMTVEYFAKDHDAILIDYYQNISYSRNDDRPEPYAHQEKFAYWINVFKNNYRGPIFVMSQIMKAKEKSISEQEWKTRIEGRKIISNFSNFFIEIVPDFDNFSTMFKIHKERMNVFQGKQIKMGFNIDDQTYVSYTEEFKAKAAQWAADKLALEKDIETTLDTPSTKEEEYVDALSDLVDKANAQVSAGVTAEYDELNLDDDN